MENSIINTSFNKTELSECIFCGRNEYEVNLLLRDCNNKKSCICDKCVETCNEILLEYHMARRDT